MSEAIRYRALIQVDAVDVDTLDNNQLVMLTFACPDEPRDYSFHLTRQMAETLRQDIAAAFQQESTPSAPK